MSANVPMIRSSARTLLADGRWHTRSEILTAIAPHGGRRRHIALTVAWLKDQGFYVAAEPRTHRYRHAFTPARAETADSWSLRLRAIPEAQRRLRAVRGERLRAIRDGRPTADWDRRISQREVTLSAMASEAGRPVLDVLSETLLSVDQEAAILSETP